MLIIVQQDATIYSFYISVNCSTCFGWLIPPIIRSIYNCNYSLCSSNYSTTAEGSRDGLTSARCCNYSYMCSSWWVELPPETCRAVYRNIKTVYSRILLDNYWHCTLHSSPSVVTLRYWLFTKLGLLQKRKMCDIKLVTSYQTYSFCLYFYTSKKVAIGIRENGSRKGTWFLQYMNFLCLIQKHGNTGWA